MVFHFVRIGIIHMLLQKLLHFFSIKVLFLDIDLRLGSNIVSNSSQVLELAPRKVTWTLQGLWAFVTLSCVNLFIGKQFKCTYPN